jgi:hypothetical protein
MSRNETTPGGCLVGCILILASAFVAAVAIGAGLSVGFRLLGL